MGHRRLDGVTKEDFAFSKFAKVVATPNAAYQTGGDSRRSGLADQLPRRFVRCSLPDAVSGSSAMVSMTMGPVAGSRSARTSS